MKFHRCATFIELCRVSGFIAGLEKFDFIPDLCIPASRSEYRKFSKVVRCTGSKYTMEWRAHRPPKNFVRLPRQAHRRAGRLFEDGPRVRRRGRTSERRVRLPNEQADGRPCVRAREMIILRERLSDNAVRGTTCGARASDRDVIIMCATIIYYVSNEQN